MLFLLLLVSIYYFQTPLDSTIFVPPQTVVNMATSIISTATSDNIAYSLDSKHPMSTEATVLFFNGTTDNEDAFVDFTPGAVKHNLKPRHETDVKVTNLRFLDPPANLENLGCQYVHVPCSIKESELVNPDKAKVKAFVEEVYWPECAKLIKDLLGATKAVPYHWRHRRMEKDTNVNDEKGIQEKPLVNFHFDNDATTAERNLRNTLGDAEAEEWMRGHWQIINIWRPVGDNASRYPLAVIDNANVDRNRDAAVIHTRNNYKANSLVIKYHPSFQFYYASSLSPDEALLFRDFDSREDPKLAGLAHGAFLDHSTPENAPPRRSIEVRVLVRRD